MYASYFDCSSRGPNNWNILVASHDRSLDSRSSRAMSGPFFLNFFHDSMWMSHFVLFAI